MSEPTYNLALRVPQAVVDRLDELVDDVDAHYRDLRDAGLVRKVSRSTVARLALDAGLAALEAKYRGKPAADPGPALVSVETAPVRLATAPTKPKPPKPAPKRKAAAPVLTVGGKRVGSSRSKPPATVAGVKLRAWREREGIQQGPAAERVGKKQGLWSRWEVGAAVPMPKDRPALEALAGIDPQDWNTPNPDKGD